MNGAHRTGPQQTGLDPAEMNPEPTHTRSSGASS